MNFTVLPRQQSGSWPLCPLFFLSLPLLAEFCTVCFSPFLVPPLWTRCVLVALLGVPNHLSPACCPAGLSTRPGAASAPSLGIFSAGKAGESRGAQAGGEALWEALAWVWQPGAAAELLQAGLTLCCRAGAHSLQPQPGNPSCASPGPQRGGSQAMPSSCVRLQLVAVGGKKVSFLLCVAFSSPALHGAGMLGSPQGRGEDAAVLALQEKGAGEAWALWPPAHAVMVLGCVQALLERRRFLRSGSVAHGLVWEQGCLHQAENGSTGAIPADTAGSWGKSQAAPWFLGLGKAEQRGRTSLFPSQ